jgi:hypothetical protein
VRYHLLLLLLLQLIECSMLMLTVSVHILHAYYHCQYLLLLLQLIDPSMRVSTDFPGWLASDETKAKLQGKNVLMYCTGGTRRYSFKNSDTVDCYSYIVCGYTTVVFDRQALQKYSQWSSIDSCGNNVHNLQLHSTQLHCLLLVHTSQDFTRCTYASRVVLVCAERCVQMY